MGEPPTVAFETDVGVRDGKDSSPPSGMFRWLLFNKLPTPNER